MADIPLQLPNLGNALLAGSQAAYYSNRNAMARDEEKRRREAQPHIPAAIAGDQAALGRVMVGDPKTASVLIQQLGRLDENKRKQIGETATYTAQAANAILQADPKDRPAIYAQMRQQGIDRGYKMDSLPETYSPQLDGVLRGHRAAAIPIADWYRQTETTARHNTPGGGGGIPTQIDLPAGGAPAPAPAPPPGRPMASAVPADVVQNTQVAGSPTGPMGSLDGPPQTAQANGGVTAVNQDFGQGAQPGAQPSPGPRPAQVVMPQGQPSEPGGTPQGPKRDGQFFYENPTQHGYTLQRHSRDKYGNTTPQVVEGGWLVFVNPQTKEVAYFKPQARPQQAPAPQGFRWTADGSALEPIPGGPQDPTRQERDRIPAGFRLAADGKSLEFIPGGPHDPAQARRSGPMTEGQANAALYADRMRKADTIIGQNEKAGLQLSGKLLEYVPLGGNYLQSEGYQLYEQARRDFINAVLRRESGAVISDAEFANAEKQYFPRPGDKPDVLKQKAENRRTALEGVSRAAGPTYKPGDDGPAPSSASGSNQMPKLGANGEGYDAIKPGQQYVAPDGSIRTKGGR